MTDANPVIVVLMLGSLSNRIGSRLLRRSLSTVPAQLDLYQYSICPFCCKTKALLKFSDTLYSGVEVNPLTKVQFKAIAELGETEEERSYKKVPVAVFRGSDGEVIERVNGSSSIIAKVLEAKGVEASEESLKWLKWADEYLAVRIYPALTDTFSSSLNAFSYLDETDFTTFEKMSAKYVGALAMVLANGKIKKKYNLGDVNEELRSAVKIWCNEAIGDKKFQGGDAISVADVGVYGILKGLEGVEGDWIDIVMGDERLKAWFGRCEEVVGAL